MSGQETLHAFLASYPHIEVDLGCGDGTFLLQCAKEEPGKGFVGVDRKELSWPPGPDNLLLLRDNADHFLGRLPRESVAALHLQFPDPWRKGRHAGKRILQPVLVREAARVMRAGGVFNLVTDDESFVTDFRELLGRDHGWREVEPAAEVVTSAYGRHYEKSLPGQVFKVSYSRV